MDVLDILSTQENELPTVSVPQTVEDLNSLTLLLRKLVQAGTLSFDEGSQLLEFFRQYRNTNALVFYALSTMEDAPIPCREEFSSLLHASEEFLSCAERNRQQLKSLDFKAVSTAFVRPFEEEYEKCVSQSNACWKEFQAISNKLDYLDERSEDYEDLIRELDEKETLYKQAHTLVDESFEILKEKQKEVAPLYGFDLDMLMIVIDKLRQISLSVIDDISKLEKGDRV